MDETTIAALIKDILDPKKRDTSLKELCKYRETYPRLPPMLWHSFGTIACLLQELVATYPLLSPPTLTTAVSNKVCNALALLQCVASHPETRVLFLNVSKAAPFEYLRLTSLGVIGALVKVDSSDVIQFLLQTEIIPLCLRIMDTGSDLSKMVATFVLQKVLVDDLGLHYICQTPERFFAVSTVLSNVVSTHRERCDARLLKPVVRCYDRLSENLQARDALKQTLPEAFKDRAFVTAIADDATRQQLARVLVNAGEAGLLSQLGLASSEPPSKAATQRPPTRSTGFADSYRQKPS